MRAHCDDHHRHHRRLTKGQIVRMFAPYHYWHNNAKVSMSSFRFPQFCASTFHILTLNLLFEICFCRFLVSCPPFGIVTLFVKVWLNNLLFKFWFCLPMDWDFSSLPWDESFLKGGSHFLAQGNSVCHLYLFSLHVMISLHNWFEKKILKIFDRKAFIFSVSKRW